MGRMQCIRSRSERKDTVMSQYRRSSRRPARVLGPVLAGLLTISGAVGIAAAEKTLQPGIFGEDDRRPASGDVSAWSAVGQVNIGGLRRRAMCTGTLVGPQIVLTAAHCVYNDGKERPFLLDRIHFVAGVRPGNTWLAHGMARCLKFPPGFVPGEVKTDIALIVLQEPMTDVPVLEIDRKPDLSVGTRLIHAAYPADRRYQLMVHRNCRVLSRAPDLLATDCDSHFAASGGPLLVETPAGMEVVAVLSRVIADTASIAVTPEAWPDMPVTASCP
jgi:protease YdgD